MASRGGPLRALTALVVGVAALPLAWWCVAQLLADSADGARAALRWTPGDAKLLSRVAELEFGPSNDEAGFRAAAQLAAQSLVKGPLESRAVRVLALEADREGQGPRAAALMSVLGARTLRDTEGQLWLFEKAMARGDYEAGFAHADAVLRRRSEFATLLFPIMISALDDPRASRALVRRLAQASKPGWRSGFLSALIQSPGKTAQARGVVALLNASRAPASEAEVGELVSKLVANGEYRLGLDTWRALTPGAGARRELIYDGAFKGAPGVAPFNWRLKQGDGLTTEIASAPDGRRSLHVAFPAAQGNELAEQLLVLAPGVYRLSGEVLAGQSDASLKLAWRILCADDGRLLGEAPQDLGGAEWRAFTTTFEIPAQGCAAQWLRLGNIGQERFATTTAWYADLTLQPAR